MKKIHEITVFTKKNYIYSKKYEIKHNKLRYNILPYYYPFY